MRRSGLSLIEVAVSGGLMLIIWLVVVSLVVAAKTAYQAASGESLVYQHGLQAMQRMSRDLQASAKGSTRFQVNPSGLSLRSYLDASGAIVTDSDGSLKAQKHVLYYVSGDQLLRRELTGEPLDKALSVEAMRSACDGAGTRLARGVVELRPYKNLSWGGFLVGLKLTLQELNENGRPTRIELDWQVYVTN